MSTCSRCRLLRKPPPKHMASNECVPGRAHAGRQQPQPREAWGGAPQVLASLDAAVLANADHQARLHGSAARPRGGPQALPRVGRYRGMHGAPRAARAGPGQGTGRLPWLARRCSVWRGPGRTRAHHACPRTLSLPGSGRGAARTGSRHQSGALAGSAHAASSLAAARMMPAAEAGRRPRPRC